MSEPLGGDEQQPVPSSAGRNLPMAIAVGLVLAALVIVTLFSSRVAFLALVAAAAGLAQFELYAVLKGKGYQPAVPLGMAAGAVLLVGAHTGGTRALSFGLSMAVVAAFMWYLADPNRQMVAANVGATVFGIVYVPFFAAHAVLLRSLEGGAWVTLAVIGATAFHDIGAYAAGSFFGRHKVAPEVSPSKSWEGLFGGTMLVFVLALAIGSRMGPLTLGSAAALAAVASIASPLGDLAESLLKRDLGVKDMGGVLPGHGGMLDRVDALLFGLPAAYWLMRGVLP